MNEKIEDAYILIADDNPKNFQLLAEILSEKGFQVGIVQDGEQALQSAQEDLPDLILLDVMMPVMDGYETCRQLKKISATKDIPIIFLTAKMEIDEVVKGLKLGAVDYVTKPFNSMELLTRVQTHLQLKFSLETISQQRNELVERTHELGELNRNQEEKNQQTQSELNVAAQFQQATLPSIQELPFLKTSVGYYPLEKVSGDVYDVYINREGAMNVFLGDVMGHGIVAALMTMMVHIALDTTSVYLPVDEIVTTLNEILAPRAEGRYVTGLLLQITPDGKLMVANAGHPALIILPADGSKTVTLEKRGVPLAAFSKPLVPYEMESYYLKEGDKFFIYTDGWYEWQNKEKEQFHFDRLLHFFEENREAELDVILTRLKETLEQFSQGHPCNDDRTILGFQYSSN